MKLWNYTMNYWDEAVFCVNALVLILYFGFGLSVWIHPRGKHAKGRKDKLKGKKNNE